MELLKDLNQDELRKWFQTKLTGRQPFFYSSVDLRDSGSKIAPVDTNLFPAGFNNLSADAVKSATNQAQEYFKTYYPNVRKVAILAENFSRNKFYWDNISILKNIITAAGFEVSVAVDDAQMPDFAESNNNGNVALTKINGSGVNADIIIANRDFTGGNAPHLAHITQPIIPPISMGWHRRRKSQHFASYDVLARDFAGKFGFDPWLISTLHKQCGQVDFKKGDGMECIASDVDKIIEKIKAKYEEYKIATAPYVFIKSDSGTFGMGIMTVKSGAEVLDMNKKLRNKMDRIKEGVQNTEVLIQEGVPTSHDVQGKPAEPFIYCMNNKPVGAILRINENRDEFSNLNSAGMYFEPVECKQLDNPCEFSPWGVIARLAGLAAVYEAETMLAVA